MMPSFPIRHCTDTVAIELKELEAAMGNSDRADDMENIVERYGEVQGRFEELDGYGGHNGIGRGRDVGP
jgi:hypothetical protein